MAVAAGPSSVTERSALELARAIRAGAASAAEVLDEHIALLQRVQARCRPLAEARFDLARQEAAAADERIAAADPSEQLPPLLGVPCTIKESIAVRGMPNCAGLISRRSHRATETAPCAQRLLDAGAILLGVTNTSELTLWIESTNRVYGRTSNAYDPARTAGGSSGGEGVAVGSGGSPIGLGTDFGGSIRLPAFFNGVFGHKPSPGAVPNGGMFPAATGEANRMLGTGPLTRRAEDLMVVLRIIAGTEGVDPFAGDVDLGDPGEVSIGDLEVILFEGASLIPVRGELRVARDRAAGELQSAGARVRHVQIKQMRRALELYLAAVASWSETGARDLLEQAGTEFSWRRALGRERPHTLALLLLLAAEPLAQRMGRRTRRALAAGEALAREVSGQIGEGVALHPPFPRVAPRHGATVGRPWVITNAAVFNLLGLPVTEVPLGLGNRGLPLGVQAVAGPGRDHVAIAVALELERRLGGWVAPGGWPRPGDDRRGPDG